MRDELMTIKTTDNPTQVPAWPIPTSRAETLVAQHQLGVRIEQMIHKGAAGDAWVNPRDEASAHRLQARHRGRHAPGPNTPATTNSGGTPAKLARPGDSSGSRVDRQPGAAGVGRRLAPVGARLRRSSTRLAPSGSACVLLAASGRRHDRRRHRRRGDQAGESHSIAIGSGHHGTKSVTKLLTLCLMNNFPSSATTHGTPSRTFEQLAAGTCKTPNNSVTAALSQDTTIAHPPLTYGSGTLKVPPVRFRRRGPSDISSGAPRAAAAA